MEPWPLQRRFACRRSPWCASRFHVLGAEIDAARKRAGFVVPEATEAGLAPWSGQIDVIHGGRGRSRLNRVGHLGTVAA